MFAQDRDLVALSPDVFRDIGWNSLRMVKGVGDVSGTTLTLTSYTVDLAAAGIGAGHVVLVDGVAYEVIARLSPTTATISVIRIDVDATISPPAPVTGKAVEIRTFGPQIKLAHRQILTVLGIEEGTPSDGSVDESAIVNPGAFRSVEALAVLNLIYTAAAAPTSADAAGSRGSQWLHRAQIFREQYSEALRQTGARLDLDGDGIADATRRASVLQLIRD